MARPFLSLLIAAGATIAGLVTTWQGASVHYVAVSRFEPDVAGVALIFAGVLLIGGAAASIALHWVGALVVGSVHALLGLLALTVPFGNPFAGGIFSPVFQIATMLSKVDPALGDGSRMFYFSGTALVVGAFLGAAALGVRSRRLSPPAGPKAVVVSSLVGGAALLGAATLLVVAGGGFARFIMQLMRYDGTLAAIAVSGGMLAGIAGLVLRWSSVGILVVGALVTVAGVAYVVLAVPPAVPGQLIGAYGLVAVAGVTFVGAALGGLARGGDEVPEEPDAL